MSAIRGKSLHARTSVGGLFQKILRALAASNECLIVNFAYRKTKATRLRETS